MTPRLYIDAPLAANASALLAAGQAHYLKNVLRRAVGDEVLVFNERDGEFAARLAELGKKGGAVDLGARRRAPEPPPDLLLAVALVKRPALETIVQKAAELGVGAIQPLATARANVERARADRLSAIAMEAAEQCGRLSVPDVRPVMRLPAFLEGLEAGRVLIFCDEAGDDPQAEWGGPEGRAAPMLAALEEVDDDAGAALLIGPEGGFSPDERTMLRARAGVLPVTLGPRILRADTAAIVALALWQAVRGDLRRR